MKLMNIEIQALGHDTFRIKDEHTIVYTDPFKIQCKMNDADLILITHDHYDHLSLNDIEKVAKSDTVIVAHKTCGPGLPTGENTKLIYPGDHLETGRIKITTVHAYNTNKNFHRKGNGVGYLFELSKIRIYHAGDTDLIPEMKDLNGRVDIALLPIGGTYVMTWEEAAEAARIIQPRFAIPMHYGSISGTRKDAENFKKALEGSKIEVRLP